MPYLMAVEKCPAIVIGDLAGTVLQGLHDVQAPILGIRSLRA
jgi:hypothetical protein